MRLRDQIDESVIKVHLESTDKEECFEEMIDLLVRAGKVEDRRAALTAIRNRETLGTTGIGRGFAVPHAKDPTIGELCITMGTSREGIEFDSVDGELVNVVVLIMARDDQPGRHVRALAEVVRLFKLPGFKEAALKADSATALLEVIETYE